MAAILLGAAVSGEVAFAAPGDISTIAGGLGSGMATDISMLPRALAARGDVLFVADYAVVRRVDLVSGLTTIVAGGGSFPWQPSPGPVPALEMPLVEITGMALDADGDLLLADPWNKRVWRLDLEAGLASTVAGGGSVGAQDGLPATAVVLDPVDVAVDSTGNVFILGGWSGPIYRVDAATGEIETVLSDLGPPQLCADRPVGSLNLYDPTAIALDGAGGLLVVDPGYSRICRVDLETRSVSLVAGEGWEPVEPGSSPAGAYIGWMRDLAFDTQGNAILPIGTTWRIWRLDRETGTVQPLAGSGVEGVVSGDGGPALAAGIGSVLAIAVSDRDDLFLSSGSGVRRVAADTGRITTVAGTVGGVMGGDGRPALEAQFAGPTAIAVDSHGSVLVADLWDNRVRRIDGLTGVVSTVAGTGAFGSAGDGGPAIAATLAQPSAVAVDAVGNVFIGDSSSDGRVRRVDATSGIIATVAGGGAVATPVEPRPARDVRLDAVSALAFDRQGRLLVGGVNRLVRLDLTTNEIVTIAGGGSNGADGSPALGAQLGTIRGLAVDIDDDIVVSATDALRRIDAATNLVSTVAYVSAAEGLIVHPTGQAFVARSPTAHVVEIVDTLSGARRRIAGNPQGLAYAPYGFAGDGGPAALALLHTPTGLAFGLDGSLLIADRGNGRIRRIELPAFCRDGTLDPGEECDDGNRVDGDGCDVHCRATACGNSRVSTDEECDDGDLDGGDGCSASCTVEPGSSCSGQPSRCSRCGDGILAPLEACDDGNLRSDDGCSASCAIEPGFSCSGQPSRCGTRCGDGILTPLEACDDGNVAPGDGCGRSCATEPGWQCEGTPSRCESICGDGWVVASREACDDGDAEDGDGCSAACAPEVGWSCAGAPSLCRAVCGDGRLLGPEQCDDGNVSRYDGCSPICEVEVGSRCAGQPSVCSRCGDGRITGFEECDDGNAAGGDCCSAECVLEPLGARCADDLNPLTRDLCDGAAAECRHLLVRRLGCQQAGASHLSLRRPERGDPRLFWSWKAPRAGLATAFGSPFSGARFGVAVYDRGGERVVAHAHATAPGGWRSVAAGGLRYRTHASPAAGLTDLDLTSRHGVASRIRARGRGVELELTAPLDLAPPIVVQLVESAAGGEMSGCWEAEFARPLVVTPSRLEARR